MGIIAEHAIYRLNQVSDSPSPRMGPCLKNQLTDHFVNHGAVEFMNTKKLTDEKCEIEQHVTVGLVEPTKRTTTLGERLFAFVVKLFSRSDFSHEDWQKLEYRTPSRPRSNYERTTEWRY